MNKSEIFNWNGKIPISDYPIFQDLEPEIIIKKSQKQVEYIQGLAIRYLKQNMNLVHILLRVIKYLLPFKIFK